MNKRQKKKMLNKRYCTPRKSLIESLKEVKLIREGKIAKRSIDDLWKCLNTLKIK